MQVTKISAYSLRSLLNKNANGIKVVGYTTRHGYSNGLQMTDRKPAGQVVGYTA